MLFSVVWHVGALRQWTLFFIDFSLPSATVGARTYMYPAAATNRIMFPQCSGYRRLFVSRRVWSSRT